jgi:hypothetical protein
MKYSHSGKQRTRPTIVQTIIGCILAAASISRAAEPLRSAPEGAASAFRTYTVRPRETDAAIDAADNPHVALVAECAKQTRRLYLFLPGTGGVPSTVMSLLHLAALNCLHVVSLSYPDETAVFNACVRERAEPDCYAAWRLEKIDGVARSAKIRIAPQNSIENRLLKLLEYLAGRNSTDGWDSFLENRGIKWDTIIVSGHSQGGGEAAMLGKIHLVARVAMFGSVTDAVGSRSGPPPAWLTKPGATPTDRYFGFAHQRDEFWGSIERSWIALGLHRFGPIVNVDSDSNPFEQTHRLTTNVNCVNPRARNCAHSTVVAPRLSPQFAQVWKYMLGIR